MLLHFFATRIQNFVRSFFWRRLFSEEKNYSCILQYSWILEFSKIFCWQVRSERPVWIRYCVCVGPVPRPLPRPPRLRELPGPVGHRLRLVWGHRCLLLFCRLHQVSFPSSVRSFSRKSRAFSGKSQVLVVWRKNQTKHFPKMPGFEYPVLLDLRYAAHCFRSTIERKSARIRNIRTRHVMPKTGHICRKPYIFLFFETKYPVQRQKVKKEHWRPCIFFLFFLCVISFKKIT